MFQKLACLILFVSANAPRLLAEPRLPHLFSDHMVLQRDMPIAIWGWAQQGETISVNLAANSLSAVTGVDGRWSVLFQALPAGGPFLLEVHGTKTIVVKDVMIGEVWVASGQSNMTYALEAAANGAEEVPKANDSGLRFFTVPKKIALEPQADTGQASWELCTSDSAKKFSAVAYFFARDLRRSLGVPVGVVLSAWAGSVGEEWTAPDELRSQPLLSPIMTNWDEKPIQEKEFARRPRKYSLEFDDLVLIPADPVANSRPLSDFDDGAAITSTGGSWSFSWQDAPDSQFTLTRPGRSGKGYAAEVSGALDGTGYANLRATLQPDGSPADLSLYVGVRFWVKGDGAFAFRTIQPSISDWDDYSTSIMKATPEWKEVTIRFKDLKQQGWGVQEEMTLRQISALSILCMTDLEDPPRPPTGLFEGMIMPLEAFRIRGAIWYQGEGNTPRAFQYRILLPALIRSWRRNLHEEELPFLIVQLPNQGSSAEFGDSWWAELREAQLITSKTVSNTGLAVTIDVGDSGNLHPPRKEEVGNRLALIALGTVYGKRQEYSGPIYEGMSVAGNEIRIRFSHTGTGLVADGENLVGFTIAGADRKFHRATARIENDTVVVSSPDVALPVAVRYAWRDSPECNLNNKEGLPASPFRTDDWPGATDRSR